MKILLLNWRDIEHPEAGGAEVHIFELFSRLVSRGHEVTLLTTRFPNSQERAVIRGIDVLRLANNFLFNWQAPFLVKKTLREKNFDCIIDDVNKLPFFSHLWFPKMRCGTLFMHFMGKTLFGMTNPVMALYVYLLERLYPLLYKSIPCCALSQSTTDELAEKGFPRGGITIVEPGIDTERFCPDDSVTREDGLLFCVGRIKRYKRVDMIIDAMRMLDESGHRTRLVVAGTGDDMPRLKKYAEARGLADRVEFAGFIDEERKIEYIRKAAIFVNPSEKEGWGITNVEAAACGTPVAANNAPGIRESVIDNETGILYKENDVVSLSSSIKKLLDDRELRSRFGERGRAFALRYSWDAQSVKLEEWLWKIVREK